MRYRLDVDSFDVADSFYETISHLDRHRCIGASISKNLVASGVHRKNVFAKVYCSAYINRVTLSEKEVFIARLNFPDLKFKVLI